MAIIKKFNKKKRVKHSGKILGMKRILSEISEQSLNLAIAVRLPEIKKTSDKEVYAFFKHVSLIIHDELSKNEDAVRLLSQTIYTNGHDDSVQIDYEKVGEYTKFIIDYVTFDKIEEAFNSFDASEEKLKLIIEGNRLEVEDIAGETTVETI